jgi:hypothetical protein
VRRFACIAGLVVVWASRASAQGALPLELDWRAPAECPAADAVRAELARIAAAREGSALLPLRARAEVRRHAGGYQLLLQTEHAGSRGTRQLTAADCVTLMRSATLVLALAFGPAVDLISDRPEAPIVEPPAAVRPPAEPTPTPAPAAAGIREHTPPTWQLWLGAGAQFGLLPAPAFSGSLGVELELARVSFGLRALVLPGVRSVLTVEEGPLDTRFAALGAAAHGCGLLPAGALALGACAGLQLAAIRGESAGTNELSADSAIAPWYAVHVALAVSWPRTAALRLRFEAELAYSLNRPEFAVEGSSAAYRVPRWLPLLAAGLTLNL